MLMVIKKDASVGKSLKRTHMRLPRDKRIKTEFFSIRQDVPSASLAKQLRISPLFVRVFDQSSFKKGQS